MQSVDFEDRRIFERFAVKFPLRFMRVGSENTAEALTYDISAKGIGLVFKEELEQDADLEIWLDIPDQVGALYARGRVVWVGSASSDGYRAGINLEKADLMGVSRALRACAWH